MSSDLEKKFARSAQLLRGETTKAALHNIDMDEGYDNEKLETIKASLHNIDMDESYDNGKLTEAFCSSSIDLNDFSIDIEGDDSVIRISKDSSFEDVMVDYDQIDNFLQKMKTIRLNGQNEDEETQTLNLSTVDGPPIEIQVNDLASLAVSNLDELESTINGDLKTLANTEEARTRLADQVLRLTEQLLEARNEIENKTSELDMIKKSDSSKGEAASLSGGSDSVKTKRNSILSYMLPNRVRKVDSESLCSSHSASNNKSGSNLLQTIFASNSGSGSVSRADIESDAVAPLPPVGKSKVGRSRSIIAKTNNDFSERIKRSSLLNSISDVFRFEEEILPESDLIRRRSDGITKTEKRKSWNRQSDSGVAVLRRTTTTRDRPWRTKS